MRFFAVLGDQEELKVQHFILVLVKSHIVVNEGDLALRHVIVVAFFQDTCLFFELHLWPQQVRFTAHWVGLFARNVTRTSWFPLIEKISKNFVEWLLTKDWRRGGGGIVLEGAALKSLSDFTTASQSSFTIMRDWCPSSFGWRQTWEWRPNEARGDGGKPCLLNLWFWFLSWIHQHDTCRKRLSLTAAHFAIA